MLLFWTEGTLPFYLRPSFPKTAEKAASSSLCYRAIPASPPLKVLSWAGTGRFQNREGNTTSLIPIREAIRAKTPALEPYVVSIQGACNRADLVKAPPPQTPIPLFQATTKAPLMPRAVHAFVDYHVCSSNPRQRSFIVGNGASADVLSTTPPCS